VQNVKCLIIVIIEVFFAKIVIIDLTKQGGISLLNNLKYYEKYNKYNIISFYWVIYNIMNIMNIVF
jgi:hypothetical protein